jgi:hypothetical protein
MDSKVMLERLVYDLEHCRIHLLIDYLAEDVIIYTWHGVVYGRKNATNYLMDFRRYQHHNLLYNKWKQVMHCIDDDIKPFRSSYASENADPNAFDNLSSDSSHSLRRSRVPGGDMEVARFHDATGFDSQGYAHFERDGFIGSHPHLTFFRIPIKQTIVLRDGQIVMINITKRRK